MHIFSRHAPGIGYIQLIKQGRWVYPGFNWFQGLARIRRPWLFITKVVCGPLRGRPRHKGLHYMLCRVKSMALLSMHGCAGLRRGRKNKRPRQRVCVCSSACPETRTRVPLGSTPVMRAQMLNVREKVLRANASLSVQVSR